MRLVWSLCDDVGVLGIARCENEAIQVRRVGQSVSGTEHTLAMDYLRGKLDIDVSV